MSKEGFYALGQPARDLLCRYARGEMYTWLNHDHGELGWFRPTHRGVQIMDALHIGHAVEKCLAQRRFQMRYNQAFDQVVRYCGDLGRNGKTWITPEQAAAYSDLHKQGYAYSCEAIQDGELVGGVFGVQIGGFISIDSMFHRANNAGKTVYGHHMLNLQQRGFHFVDVSYASEHCKRFGAEWVHQWQFEHMMRPVLKARIPLFDDQPAPILPWHLLAAQRGMQMVQSAGRRVANYFSHREQITAGTASTPPSQRAQAA